MPVIPGLGRRQQENLKFEVTLGYVASSRPACSIQDPVSKTKQTNKKTKKEPRNPSILSCFFCRSKTA
jgi:hypothetical protein